MSDALRVIGKGNRQRLVFATNGGKILIVLPVEPSMRTASPSGFCARNLALVKSLRGQ